ncbi:MAG: DNA polymerase III subunit delta, partial [Pseudomonadota bacterium]
LSRTLDPGDFAQTVEKVALYCLGADQVTVADIDACSPASTEAEVDDLLNIVAEARTEELGPVLRRLEAQGVTPVTICIQAMRHFKTLHAAAADPSGVSQGIARVRPPVFGPRRDRMQRQAGRLGRDGTEKALATLTETDLTLRSANQTAPQMAVMERALIRLAMTKRR